MLLFASVLSVLLVLAGRGALRAREPRRVQAGVVSTRWLAAHLDSA